MLVFPIFAVIAFFYSGLSHALTVHETCKNFPGVDEYGYGPDVSAAVSTAYDYMRMIANNAVSVADKYQSNSLPPDERVRFASLLTAFGVPEGDSRLPFFLIQLDAAWGLLGSKVNLGDSIIFCGTPEGKDQWTYVPKTPLGQNWAWRNYQVDPPFDTQDRYRICQDPTHKGAHYSPGTWAFTIRKNVNICPAGFQGLPPSGFPTSLEDRGQDFSKIKGEDTLEWWGRSLIGLLMHELHHVVSDNNIDAEIPQKWVPPGFPAVGVVRKAYIAYGYAGISALANWIQNDKTQKTSILSGNPDTITYFAMALWLFGNDWQDNDAKPVPGGVDSNPADQQATARKMIRDAIAVPHLDHNGTAGTRFVA